MPTPLRDLLTHDLPDPTIPVPFERFQTLKESDDMLHRAAFWAFYAAWQDSQHNPTEVMNAIAVEARHDGHTFAALASELHIRDAVIMSNHDVEMLNNQMLVWRSMEGRPTKALCWLVSACMFLLGTLCMWAAYGFR